MMNYFDGLRFKRHTLKQSAFQCMGVLICLFSSCLVYANCFGPAGDMNNDFKVDSSDLVCLAEQWLIADANNLDPDGSGWFDLSDLSVIGREWLTVHSPIIISEFMASNDTTHSTVVDGVTVYPDWVELYNMSSVSVSLDGWHLTDKKNNLTKWRFPDGIVMNPSQTLVVFASDKTLAENVENYPYQDDSGAWHTNFSLDSAGEYLAIVPSNEVSRYEYAPEYPVQYSNVSYGPVFSADCLASYFVSPTPGSHNVGGASYPGPVITNITITPENPSVSDPLVITAQINQTANPVSSVSLHYRVMYGAEVILSMGDSGSNGDQIAGDGVYSAAIAPGVAQAGQMFRWYITADDDQSNRSRWPLFHDPLNSPEYMGVVFADPTVNSSLPVLSWFVQDPVAAMTDTGTRASIHYNGRFYDNIFVRRRGASTASWPKRKFKFDFNQGDHFEYDGDQPRVEEINLQSHWKELYTGGGRYHASSYMRENVSFLFMQDAGVPASNTSHLHLRQNGSFYGLYSFVEQVDDIFLKRNKLPVEGAVMYKAVSSSATRSNLSPNPSSSVYQEVIPGDNSQWDKLVALTVGIDETNPNRREYVFDNIDLPQVVNEMAAHTILLNADRLVKNYYMYRHPVTGEWSRIPWDLEMGCGVDVNHDCCRFLSHENFNSPLYGDNNHTQGVGNESTMNYLNDAILDIPETRQMYMRRIRTLIDGYLDAETGYFEGMVTAIKAQIELDADMDHAIWGAGDIDLGVDTIIADTSPYSFTDTWLPTRRTQLFDTYGPSGSGLIPAAQTANPVITIGTVEFNPPSFNQDEEFIELVNSNAYAVDISGWKLTDAVDFTFAPGTVIPANDNLYISPNVAAFRARTDSPKGGEGNFVQGSYKGHLSSWGETIKLLDLNSNMVDTLTYSGNPSDQQRYLRVTELMFNPEADSNQDLEYIELKNIGTVPLDLTGVKFTNGIDFTFVPQTEEVSNETLVSMTDSWSYEQSNMDLPDDWVGPGYDDSDWHEGCGLLYAESDSLPAPKNTALTLGARTYYFRKHFTLDSDLVADSIAFQLDVVIDDGAVIYLNGQEAYRLGMPAGTIEHSTFSSRSVDNAVVEGPFSIDPNLLVAGDNVIAVEVHQRADNSSDIVFGLSLDAVVTKTTGSAIMSLEPGQHLLLVSNQSAFESKYDAGLPVAGQYTGFLDNGGENIKLEDKTNSTILDFSYSDNWYVITDGEGFSLTVIDPSNALVETWGQKVAWRPSSAIDGTPGVDDQGSFVVDGAIVINEVLAHSDTISSDFIELHNTTDEVINIGGWFLSDSDSDLMKYEIPLGTSIDPNGYMVFYENTHFGILSTDPGAHTPFALSENGETVYLSSGQDRQLTGYSETEEFGASGPDVAFGRYEKSTGAFNFVAMSSNTPGIANAYPKVGPVVITEIMYHPQTNGDAEYVELKNISGENVTLYDYTTKELWRFVDDAGDPGIEFYFPTTPVTIAAGQTILLIKNETAFKSEYGVNSLNGITWYEWIDGGLSNGGEKPELQMPGDVNAQGVRQYIRIDRVSYDDTAPWPTSPDGTGQSLTKPADKKELYGNDVQNWQAATPTPGH